MVDINIKHKYDRQNKEVKTKKLRKKSHTKSSYIQMCFIQFLCLFKKYCKVVKMFFFAFLFKSWHSSNALWLRWQYNMIFFAITYFVLYRLHVSNFWSGISVDQARFLRSWKIHVWHLYYMLAMLNYTLVGGATCGGYLSKNILALMKTFWKAGHK